MSTHKHLLQLIGQRQQLINDLMAVEQMLRGSYGVTYRRCGTATCWCAQDKGHPVNRITWTEDGKSRTRAVPLEDIDWIKRQTQAYKKYRKNRRALRAIDKKISEALDNSESRITRRTSHKKKYLRD